MVESFLEPSSISIAKIPLLISFYSDMILVIYIEVQVLVYIGELETDYTI